ncbi:MAG: hypothetical protein ABIJ04_02180 [Bacteroidota bacterium]
MKKVTLIAIGIIVLLLGTGITIFGLKMNSTTSVNTDSRVDLIYVEVSVTQAPDCYEADYCNCVVQLYHPVTRVPIGTAVTYSGTGTYYPFFDNDIHHISSVIAAVYCGTGDCEIESTPGTAYEPEWECSCGACQ